MLKQKSIKVGSKGLKKEVLNNFSATDQTFNGGTGTLSYLTSKPYVKIVNSASSAFNFNGQTATSGSSYPRAWWRAILNKNLYAYSLNYGSGTLFWGTDDNNWWGAFVDVDTTTSGDPTYACGSYAGYYTCVANAPRYGVCVQYSATYYCTGYVVNGYTNNRYNGAVRVIKMISGSVSTVASYLWNYTQLYNISVSFDAAGNAVIVGYDTGNNPRVSGTVSGGPTSGTTRAGLLGGPVTNAGYIQTISINRITQA
jgi:hypothetical protein